MDHLSYIVVTYSSSLNMPGKPRFVELQATDMKTWQAIRHDMLTQHPEAFAGSVKKNLLLTSQAFVKMLKTNRIFTLQRAGRILSILCLESDTSNEKTMHKGYIWGVYTPKHAQKKGYSHTLFQHVLSTACSHLAIITLTCMEDNTHALTFYKKLGFYLRR